MSRSNNTWVKVVIWLVVGAMVLTFVAALVTPFG